MKKEITIVGAGIIGSMLAWRLAKAGCEVTLIDADNSHPPASDGSLCWLNACSSNDINYSRLRAESIRQWHSLAAEHAECPVHFKGSVLWENSEQDLVLRESQLNSINWPVERVRDHWPSDVNSGHLEIPASALYLPLEGAAHPAAILDWTRQQAIDAGVFRRQANVASITTRSGSVSAIRLESGEVIEANTIVIAAGTACQNLLSTMDIHLPMRPGGGQVIWTEPVQAITGSVIASPQVDFWQDACGRILMSGPQAKTSEQMKPSFAKTLIHEVEKIVPQLSDTQVQRVIFRERPIPGDGLPALGKIGPEGLWLATTHSGMTLAPVIATALSEEILGQTVSVDISRYQATRFG